MMKSDRIDLREIAHAVLTDLPQTERLSLMTEMMVEASGAAGLHQLSKARAAISVRMQEMITSRFPMIWGVDLAEGPDQTASDVIRNRLSLRCEGVSR